MTIVDLLIHLVMILVILICIVPFLYMLALSLSSPSAIINSKVTFYPVGLNFDAYIQIFTYPNFFKAYGNTIFYTVAGTLIALFTTTVFAYAMSKRFLYGHKLIMKLIVFSMFFSGGLIPTYLLISNLHLTGTVWAMLLPFAINQFNLIILINFIRAVPAELEEAAIIDGLDYFGILLRVIVPLSTPALATIGLFTAVFFWNDWFNGLIYLNTNQYPVMLFLRNIVNGTTMVGDGAGAADKSTIAMSIKSAVIITSTLPIIILYPLLQRFFVSGLTLGSIKG
ncbi:ABC transporter permease [Cohnella kolymensis]|uniref:ABC transporter permease n=2 Tax=Cohnella kolymensis TaxID=1590652 RepID=A0ABR5A9H5_9BACL|nr:ABC transporter permease [Cohnella kolymensis]